MLAVVYVITRNGNAPRAELHESKEAATGG